MDGFKKTDLGLLPSDWDEGESGAVMGAVVVLPG